MKSIVFEWDDTLARRKSADGRGQSYRVDSCGIDDLPPPRQVLLDAVSDETPFDVLEDNAKGNRDEQTSQGMVLWHMLQKWIFPSLRKMASGSWQMRHSSSSSAGARGPAAA